MSGEDGATASAGRPGARHDLAGLEQTTTAHGIHSTFSACFAQRMNDFQSEAPQPLESSKAARMRSKRQTSLRFWQAMSLLSLGATLGVPLASFGSFDPPSFESGQPISAQEMNALFQEVKDSIDRLEAGPEFLGSSTPYTGPTGLSGARDLCASEHGAGARACTAHDIMLLAQEGVTPLPGQSLWYLGSGRSEIPLSDSTFVVNCEDFTSKSPTSRGFRWTDGPQPTSTATCDNDFSFACCR